MYNYYHVGLVTQQIQQNKLQYLKNHIFAAELEWIKIIRDITITY